MTQKSFVQLGQKLFLLPCIRTGCIGWPCNNHTHIQAHTLHHPCNAVQTACKRRTSNTYERWCILHLPRTLFAMSIYLAIFPSIYSQSLVRKCAPLDTLCVQCLPFNSIRHTYMTGDTHTHTLTLTRKHIFVICALREPCNEQYRTCCDAHIPRS